MRTSPLPAIAVVALLVLAGCTGLPGTGETESTPEASPSDFPNASAIDQSVFDTHATAMGNTSFTLSTVKNRTDRNPTSEEKFRYMNDSGRALVEPSASQYLVHTTGYFSGNGSTYSNGSTAYMLNEDDNSTRVRNLFPTSVFNESGEQYLWRGFFSNEYDYGAINATYERKGVEMFQGVPVMRYEANGTDALTGKWAPSENARWNYENFSATLLLDEDGVIRHYQYTFVKPSDHHSRVRYSRTYTLSDVGNTDVEKPDWAKNATAGS